MQRFLLWERRNNTVMPFNETVQQVFARVSALRDSLDGPQVHPHLLSAYGTWHQCRYLLLPVPLTNPSNSSSQISGSACQALVCALSSPDKASYVSKVQDKAIYAFIWQDVRLSPTQRFMQVDDQGLVNTDPRNVAVPNTWVNLIPTDLRGLTFSRTPQMVSLYTLCVFRCTCMQAVHACRLEVQSHVEATLTSSSGLISSLL